MTGSKAVFAALALLAAAPFAAQDDAACLACHAEPSMFDGPRASALVVAAEAHDASVHAPLGCVGCHQDLAGVSEFPHAAELAPVDCAACHGDVASAYETSIHGYARARGNGRAPSCTSCHGIHDVLPSADPRSKTHKVHLPATCIGCHGEAGLLTDELVKLPRSFTDYAKSVHGRGTARGLAAAASCADCHGVHDLRGPTDPASRIHPLNVARTCGACHPDVQLEYDASIHGRALAAGVSDSPTCTGCHGEHLILSPDDPSAGVSSARQATDTCGRCHNDPKIVAKYRLEPQVVASYEDSYHGWATRRGYQAAAACVDCHTAHAVLPAQHPDSSVSSERVVATCSRCHPGADARFAASYTHESASLTANPINRFLRNAYWALIALVIGGMLLHNAVILNFYLVERRRALARGASVERLDRSQIVQHLVLALSFTGLAVTGFALRFPDAAWVRGLTALGMSEGLRADLHRVLGVTLVVASAYHLAYLALTRRGRQELRAMRPGIADARQTLDNLRFHLWRRRERVPFGRYDYTQKAEYWALIWGTVVMVLTGMVLWWPTTFVKFLPVWIVSASQTVHYYEAWLATLAILVWHLFFVVFHPEQYPMSWTWLTGKMPLHEAREHHGAWYATELAAKPEPPRTPAGPHPGSNPGD